MVDVSVIVTSYNVEHYIMRAIQSALDQTGVTVEVIVADDCSSDGTWARIQSFNDPRVKAIQLPANQGPSGARNTAIAQATGTWLAVLDGDDVFLPGRLQRCVALAVESKADIVIDNLQVNREADGKTFPMFLVNRFPKQLTLEAFIEGNSNFMGGYGLGYVKPIFLADFVKRHELRYPESIRIGEDYLFLLEALARGAVCVGDLAQGYGYTARVGSISHRLSLEAVKRIQSTDTEFFARYVVSEAAQRAQAQRAQNLVETYAYTKMLETLKRQDVIGFLCAVKLQPLALRQLWRPVKARLVKLLQA